MSLSESALPLLFNKIISSNWNPHLPPKGAARSFPRPVSSSRVDGSSVVVKTDLDAPSEEESIQTLISQVGELQIKKGFLLSKFGKLQGQLSVAKHVGLPCSFSFMAILCKSRDMGFGHAETFLPQTQSIEPALENLCAQRVKLYDECVKSRQKLQRLRCKYDAIEETLGNLKGCELLYVDRNEVILLSIHSSGGRNLEQELHDILTPDLMDLIEPGARFEKTWIRSSHMKLSVIKSLASDLPLALRLRSVAVFWVAPSSAMTTMR